MKHPSSLLAISMILLLVFSCRNNKQPVDTKTKDEEAKKNYFPVIDFMKSEISIVDSTPIALLKYDIRDNHSDSSYIKRPEFNQVAMEFLPSELDSPYFQQHFTESSFFDQTSKSITFTYSSKDSTSGLHRVDVLATPQSDGSSKVKSIYMEKTIDKKDTFILKKLYWVSQKSFFIITITHPIGQNPVTQQLKVVWDNSDQ
jgi:hypothetical protein